MYPQNRTHRRTELATCPSGARRSTWSTPKSMSAIPAEYCRYRSACQKRSEERSEGNRAGDDALFFGAVAEYIMIKGSAY